MAGPLALPSIAPTEPFVTNIVGGPELVTIGGGIDRIGRPEKGMVVARRVKPGG
jgi:hypothetical protein